MPTSWYQAIPHLLEMVQSENPSSILDIGVGFGKYGLLLRDMLELPFERYHKQQWKLKLDGVEVFSEYKNPIHDYIYDHIYYDNIVDIVDKLPHYDVILMIDIIEHFNKEEGLSLIAKLLKRTKKCLIVSTPLYPANIKTYLGSEYDQHKSRWWELDFVDFDVAYKFIPIGTNGAYIVKIFPTKHHGSYHVRELNYSRNQIMAENRPLNIGYILPHKKLTGGLKLLLEQMRQLKQRGHNIIVLFRGNKGESVIPEWSNVIVDKEILVPINQSYVNYIQGCDIVIAGWFEQLPELAQSKVPVLYLEQGHEFLFGEFVNNANYLKIRQYLKHCYSQPCAIAAVSALISKLLYVRYNRNAPVITNGIDTDFYHPGEPPNDNIILLVGNPTLRFKGFDVALRALENLWRAGYRFKVNWVSQVHPQIHGKISYPINLNIMPSQEELALFYRKADVFLFTSWYEGFGMPPLEAMASGVPVVATQCGGIEVYAQPGYNSLLADPGDNQSLAGALAYLFEDEQTRKLLSIRGRETALQFQWSNVIQQLEGYLYDLVSKENKRQRAEKKIKRKKKRVALIYTNLSGSNTIAMYKLGPKNIKDKFDIQLVPGDLSNTSKSAILNSDIAIFTEGNYPFKSKNSNKLPVVIDLWHGFPLKAMGFADRGEKFKHLINEIWDNIDYLTSYSSFFNEIMNKCISIDMSKYVITGAQRNDFLFSSNGKKNLAYLLDDKLLMNNKKIIFYMPTYRYTPRGNRTEGNRNWMNIFGFSSFDMRNFIVFLEENDYYFIIKLHPAEEKKFIDKIPPNKNIIIITNEILGKKGLDLYEILNAANIIITDYSSVYFDTLLLDIPVVFTPIDIEEYQRDRGFLLEPYEKWTPGPKCLTQETLQEEIFKSLSDHSYFNKERKDLLKKIHKYVDGNSCKRTWKFIEQLSENI